MRLALAAGALALAVPAVVFGLASGDPALTVLGQASMTQAYPNAVTAEGFDLPQAVAIGGGRVYAADSNNSRVLWWSLGAFVNGQAAEGVLGQADAVSASSNRGGAAAANTLSYPNGVAVDAAGAVWVADSGNNRVLRYAAPAGNGPSANLVLGQAAFNANGFNTSAATMDYPTAVAVDAAGNVWVADAGNNRVLKFNTPPTNGASAGLVLGQAGFVTRTAAASLAGMDFPMALALGAGNTVWVADFGNSRVLRYDAPALNGADAARVLGQADFTSNVANRGGAVAANTLSYPLSVAVDGTDVWVADAGNSRLLRFLAPAADGVAADLELGQADLLSGAPNRGGVVASATTLAEPAGLAVAVGGDVWASDSLNHRVLRYPAPAASSAAADLALGQPDFAELSANAATNTTLRNPNSAAVDPNTGRVYAADFDNNRVLWWNSGAGFADGQAADGVLGQSGFSTTLPNRGGAAGADTMNGPFSVAVNAAGDLWVNDSGNYRILRFDPPAGNGEAANRVLGQADFLTTTPVPASQTSVLGASGMATDASNRLWVADSGNNRVLRFNDFTADGAPADFVLGQAGYGSGLADRGGAAGAGTLDFPTGVAADAAGNIWVADSGNNRVLKYTAFPANGPDATLVLGQAGFLATSPAATQTGLDSPSAVLVEPFGNVWVADSFNSRVLRYDAPAADGPAASIVLGQADFLANAPNRGAAVPAANTLAAPNGLAMDSAFSLWIADSGNNRLVKHDGFPKTPLAPAFTVISSVTLTASWTAVGGANYVVVFSPTADFSVITSSVTQAAATASFTGLTPETMYYLEVKLAGEADAAYLINRVSVRTQVAATPLAPAVTALSSTTFSAAWTALGGANYVVVLSPMPDFSVISSSASQAGVSKTFEGLNDGVNYYFEVKLATEADAAYSVNRLAVRTDDVTPLAPTFPAAGARTLDAAWTAVAGANYVVVLSPVADFSVITSSVTQAGETASFANLSPETPYYLQVKLSTEADSAYLANRASRTTLPAGTALSPALSAVGATGFNADWTAVAGADYVAVLATDAGFTQLISSVTQAGNSSVFGGLSEYTMYYFEVKLATESDAGYASNGASVRTLAVNTPLAPSLTVTGDSSITAAWTSVGGAQYVVVLSTAADFSVITSSVTQAAASASFLGLTPDTPYYLQVKLATEPDAAYAINRATARTRATAMTAINPIVSMSVNGDVGLVWPYSETNTYVMVMALDPAYSVLASSWTTAIGDYNEQFEGLTGTTSYYFEMKLSTESDAAFAVNRFTVHTPVHQVFPNPYGVSGTSFGVSWSTAPGAGYVAILATDQGYSNIVSSVAVAVTGSSAAFTGLNPDSLYYYAVKNAAESDAAYTALGNWGYQRTSPTSLVPSLTAVSATSLSASWTPAPTGGHVVVLAVDSGFGAVVSSATQAGFTKTFDGLSPYTTYYLQVKAAGESDAGYAVNRAALRTPADGAVAAPALVAASSTTLALAWTVVSPEDYVAVLASDQGYQSIVSSAAVSGGVKTYEGLSPDTSYYFMVKRAAEGDGAYTLNELPVMTVPTPLSPTVGLAAPGRLQAAWSGTAGRYYVAVLALDPEFTNVISSVTTESSVANFMGVRAALAYFFQVKDTGESERAFAANRVSTVTVSEIFQVTSVTPDKASSGTQDIPLTINGQGIYPGSTAKLTRAGFAEVLLDNVTVVGPTQMTAVLHQPIAPGQWNVQISSEGLRTSLANGFTILETSVGEAKVYGGIFQPGLGQSAQIVISLLTPGTGRVRVYNSVGNLIQELYNGFRPAGEFIVSWDGRVGGSLASAGIYLVRIETPDFSATKRILLVR
ncbi:MAG: hypothetical protein HY924_09765 [Elusimicrobia bacterium]|nr:hypothetical protein [Elusimicrobiota bacterium]